MQRHATNWIASFGLVVAATGLLAACGLADSGHGTVDEPAGETMSGTDGLEHESHGDGEQGAFQEQAGGFVCNDPNHHERKVTLPPDGQAACAVEAVKTARDFVQNRRNPSCGSPMAPTSLGGRVDYNPRAGGAVAVGSYVRYWYNHLATDICHWKRPYYVAYKAFAECLKNRRDWSVGNYMDWKKFKGWPCDPNGHWIAPTYRDGPTGHDWCAPGHPRDYPDSDNCVLWEFVPKNHRR